MKKETNQLVDGTELLESLFSKESRPSIRWLRERQAKREIPFVKVGRLIRFDVEAVRKSLSNAGAKRT